jgi:cell filamentation protein
MEHVFRQLKEDDFLRGRSFEGFIDGAAAFLGELNAIHPFREGNGRAQLSFVHLLSIKAGHPLALVKIRPAEFLAAMIASFNGNLRPMIAELTRLRA